MALGPHKLEYEVVQGREHLPEGWSFTEVAGVAVDSRDRVYVLNRGRHPVIVFDKEGRFLGAWGEGRFVRPHGIFITRRDQIFLVDDEGHTVYRCLPSGKVEMRLGNGQPSDTGYEPWKSPVQRAAGPFNAHHARQPCPLGGEGHSSRKDRTETLARYFVRGEVS